MSGLEFMRLVSSACKTHPEWGPWACEGDNHVDACVRKSVWANPKDDCIAALEQELERTKEALHVSEAAFDSANKDWFERCQKQEATIAAMRVGLEHAMSDQHEPELEYPEATRLGHHICPGRLALDDAAGEAILARLKAAEKVCDLFNSSRYETSQVKVALEEWRALKEGKCPHGYEFGTCCKPGEAEPTERCYRTGGETR